MIDHRQYLKFLHKMVNFSCYTVLWHHKKKISASGIMPRVLNCGIKPPQTWWGNLMLWTVYFGALRDELNFFLWGFLQFSTKWASCFLWESKSSFYFYILQYETKLRPLKRLNIPNTYYFCLKRSISVVTNDIVKGL